MNETRQTFRRYAIGLGVTYLGFVLILNHLMLTEDPEGLRAWFYLFAIAIPVGVIGSWRVIARTHRGEDEDEAVEGVVLLATGLSCGGALWAVSTFFY